MSNRFQRRIGTRRYRQMFIISTEGSLTEPQYFQIFNTDTKVLHVKVLNNTASNPGNVLKQIKKYLRRFDLEYSDQAWLVIDKDQWQDSQIQPLYDWSHTNPMYGFALSNPKFEYWLLLHFENPRGIRSSQACSNRLKHHLPDYDKHINEQKIKPHIQKAIDRAKRQDTPPCTDWPRTSGTTVYRLVEKLLKDQNL